MKAFFYLTMCMGLVIIGCGDDESGTDGDGNNSGTTEICEQMIECARVTGQAGVPALVETYGKDGECWNMEGVRKSDCWNDCRVTMAGFRALEPDEPACRECVDASECEVFGNAYCNLEGVCSDSICGNEILEGDEVCDNELDDNCNDDCTHDYHECNPLNDPGACSGPNEKCDIEEDSYDEHLAICVTQGTGGLYDECTDASDCEVGMACVIGSRIRECPNGGPYCCTPWCDTSASSDDCPDGLKCFDLYDYYYYGDLHAGYCGSSA